mgnify:CR=1 FL=1
MLLNINCTYCTYNHLELSSVPLDNVLAIDAFLANETERFKQTLIDKIRNTYKEYTNA